MAVNYLAAVKTNRLRTVADAIDAKTFVVGSGGGSAGATLVIGTSALSGATGVLSTHTLALPCGTASGTALTFTLPSAVNASATGAAALAEIRASGGAVIVGGLVCGVGSGEVQLNSLSITSGQSVNITAMAINHP
jgi:hypothetical protein